MTTMRLGDIFTDEQIVEWYGEDILPYKHAEPGWPDRGLTTCGQVPDDED